MKPYIKNILISIDQFFNALTGGDPDETISSRVGKKQKSCLFCRFLCKLLNKIDPNHCESSIELDRGDKDVR